MRESPISCTKLRPGMRGVVPDNDGAAAMRGREFQLLRLVESGEVHEGETLNNDRGNKWWAAVSGESQTQIFCFNLLMTEDEVRRTFPGEKLVEE